MRNVTLHISIHLTESFKKMREKEKRNKEGINNGKRDAERFIVSLL